MTQHTTNLFDGPVTVMLTKAQDTIPRPATAAQLAYEMKWDGYRAALQVTPAGTVRLWSRNGTDLSRAFPDLIAAAEVQVPPGFVLDGEAVAWVDGRLSFDHLQQRMAASAAAARRLANQHPASYVAFDVLAVDGTDVRGMPWRDRRTLLDTLAAGFQSPIEVSPVTEDYDTAAGWFTDLPAATGIEGIVVKRQSSRYSPGERGWVKVKRRSHHDAVVGAVIGPVSRPEAIIAGRYTADGQLRVVGRSGPLSAQHVDELARALTEVRAEDHPWPTEISSGHFGGGKVTITHVAPTVVVEVSADAATQGGRHRHALRVVRIRWDLVPDEVTVDENDLS